MRANPPDTRQAQATVDLESRFGICVDERAAPGDILKPLAALLLAMAQQPDPATRRGQRLVDEPGGLPAGQGRRS